MRYRPLPLRVLVVDADAARRARLCAALTMLEQNVFAVDGCRSAMAIYEEARPDLILLDVTDGTAARLRAMDPQRRVPIGLLCASQDSGTLTRCLESGADWALPREPSAAALRAVIGGAEHLQGLEQKLEEKRLQLEQNAARLEDEMAMARRLLGNVLHGKSQRFPELRSWITPASKFSGDVIAAERSPAGAIHLMLADGVGHGLAATFIVAPLTRAFLTMTAKGFVLGTIAAELNQRIHSYEFPGLFVAATLVAYLPAQRRLEVWNGGNPDALLVGEDGELIRRFASQHLPLGVLDSAGMNIQTETIEAPAGSELLVFSDGLIEAGGSENGAYGEARLLESIAWCAPGARHHAVAASIRGHLGGREAEDDISFAVLDCDKIAAQPPLAEPEPVIETLDGFDTQTEWSCGIRVGATTLKRADIVPLLQQLVKEIDPRGIDGGRLFVVLSELFNNALDHGLLGLESTLKDGPDGIEHYLDERARRLGQLERGEIEIEITRLCSDDAGGLRVRVRDSGEGFDHRARLTAPQQASELPHGRGIELVRGLASSVAFSESGNAVEVVCAD
jgi:serine phosphatase RsbU (regulator of sigma subunit)/anti-sigma regulatory factor (Ser/Thr protein kinase)